MSEDIRQLKLSNGDEIICEVVEWNSEDTDVILVKHAFIIVTVENVAAGMRYFTFRPWMTYSDDPSKLMNINASMIVGECVPTGLLFNNYKLTIENAYKESDTSDKDTLDKLYEDAMNLLSDVDSAETQNTKNFYVEDETYKIH
jgi:hypothetical protein